jgi:hydrogenase maturation protease
MSQSLVEKIADAVLYEGYILYPYRPSAVKNQQRWNFGALCPESYSVAQAGTESWTMQTQCVVRTNPLTSLNVKVRFLHLLTREVRQRISDQFQTVPSLEVNGKLVQTWQEAVEREVLLPEIRLHSFAAADKEELDSRATRVEFSFPASQSIEPLSDEVSAETVGMLVRSQQAIDGAIEVTANRVANDALKLTVRILNLTPFAEAAQKSRDDALMRSFVSTHTILTVQNGEFVSLLDPPESLRDAAAGCKNVGTYPVLVGEEGTLDCMLSSPIILYDYPQIAPESAGNLYDGTEIDEILTLRIMTLTDEEKREMRGADDRARQILERTETLPLEQLMKMHGAMKSVK